jgi:hypothetical protein
MGEMGAAEMKTKIACLALLTGLTAALPVWAEDRAARTPEMEIQAVGTYPIVYNVTGLRDDGGAGNAGIATTFHCTNPSPFLANVQIVIYNFDGTLKVNRAFQVDTRHTYTASTHSTVLYDEDAILNSGVLNQGYGQIRSDNANLLCAGEVVDASPNKKLAVTLIMRSARGE